MAVVYTFHPHPLLTITRLAMVPDRGARVSRTYSIWTSKEVQRDLNSCSTPMIS